MNNEERHNICIQHSGFEAKIGFLCRKIDDLEKLINVQLHAHKEASSMAKSELERRLETMNEFRSQLTSQATTFATIKEVDIRLDKLEREFNLKLDKTYENLQLTIKSVLDKLKIIETNQSKEEGSTIWRNFLITALISMAIFLAGHFILKIY